VRPKDGAPVSAPCTWGELERGVAHPRAFHLRGLLDRLGVMGDLWADMTDTGYSLERPIAELRRLGS
jgi:bifunctional non-homologous end joining protein LigD